MMNIETEYNNFGRPYFYYHLDRLNNHLDMIEEASKNIAHIFYATKANPHQSIINCIDQKSFHFDAASKGEIVQLINSGVNPKEIIITGPAKSKEFFEFCLKRSIQTFVLESTNQVLWLNEIANKYSKTIDVLLRIQFETNTDETSVLGGNDITPFGLSLTDWESIDIKNYPWLNFLGIHNFQWGNINCIQSLEKIWRTSISKAIECAKTLNFELKIIDLGGGLGVNYQDESIIDFKKAMNTLDSLKREFNIQEIWLELGRFMIAPFGHYVNKIIDIKTVRGKKLIVLEGGINHILRPAITNEPFPIEKTWNENDSLELFSLHGPLCTSLDFLGDYHLPKNIEIGDILQFNLCGAYAQTESMPYFLCHQLPADGHIINGKFHSKFDLVQDLNSFSTESLS